MVTAEPATVSTDDPGAATSPRRADVRRTTIEVMPWLVIPTALAVWVAVEIERYYFVFDEWVMLDRARSGSGFREMFIGFNGHLWVLASWIGRFHVDVIGVESIGFSYAVLVASLVALQIAASAVLVRLGVPSILALLTTAVVVYFGRGSETMVYSLEYSANFALALTCAAAFVALRASIGRREVAWTAGLLVAATLVDSGLALVGLCFVAAIVLWTWPRRLAFIAFGVALAAHAIWFVVDETQVLVPGGHCQNCAPVTFSAPIGDSVTFGWHLLARAAGGLIGGYETAGVVALVLAVSVTTIGVVRHRLAARVVAALVGGTVAAAAAVGSITYSRAGFWPTVDEAIDSLEISNRYLHPVAFFLALGLAPVVVATLRTSSRVLDRVLTVAASGALVVVFALNLSSVDPTREFYEGWSNEVRDRVQQSVTVLSEGCGPGRTPNPDARPVEDFSFQITVEMLQDLLDRGALTESFGAPSTPEVRRAICSA